MASKRSRDDFFEKNPFFYEGFPQKNLPIEKKIDTLYETLPLVEVLALPRLQTLSAKVKVADDGILILPSSISTVPTFNSVQSSWFISLIYNFSRAKK